MLTDAILDAIGGDGPAWFPGLAEPLATSAWRSLAACGLDLPRYSTRAFLAGPEGTTGDTVTDWSGTEEPGAGLGPRLEWPTPPVRTAYEANGLEFLDRSSSEWVEPALMGAVRFLADMPTLIGAVRALAVSVHPLRCGSEDEDISYSDPAVPFSIFVGVHQASSGEYCLRLAESVVHESMHLQLSLIERHVPMVADVKATAHSPWRNEARPVQGVLHGAYVFGCILDFYRGICCCLPADPRLHLFCRRRIAKIQVEIREALGARPEAAVLTEAGSLLAERLLCSAENG